MPLNARDLFLFLRAENLTNRQLKKFADDIRDAGKAVRLAQLEAEKADLRALATSQRLTMATKQAELAHLQRSKALQAEAIRIRQADEATKRLEISLLRNNKALLQNTLRTEQLTTANEDYINELKLGILEIDEQINHHDRLLIQHQEATARVKEHVGALDLDILARRKEIDTMKNQTLETRRRIAAIDDETRAVKRQIKEFNMKKELDEVAKEHSNSFFRQLFTPNRQILGTLRTGIPAVLSSPIGVAALVLGGIFVASFIAAVITAFATAGLGAIIVAAATVGLLQLDDKVKAAANRWVETIKGVFGRAIRPLAAPLLLAFRSLEEGAKRIEPLLTKMFAALGPAIGPLVEGMIGFVEEFLKVLTSDPKTLQDVAAALTEIGRQLPGLGKSMGEFFKTLSENEDNIKNINTIFTILNNTLKVLGGTFSWLATEFRKTVDLWNETTADLREEWDKEWNSVVTTAKEAVQSIKEEWEMWKQAALGVAAFFQGPFVQFFRNAWNSVIAGFEMLRQRVQGALMAVASFVGEIVNRIITFFQLLPGRVWGIFAGMANSAVAGISSLPGRVMAVLNGLVSAAYNAGRNIVSAIARGIRDNIPTATSAMQALGAAIRRFWPGSPVKEGPLRVLNNGRAGGEIVKMLAAGIRSSSGLLNQEMGRALLLPDLRSRNVQTPVGTQQPIVQNFYITTQEIDPRVHASQLGWELRGRL